MIDIATAFSALAGAQTVLRAAISTRDDAKIASATQELNGRIIEIQGVCLQLQQDKSAAIESERSQKDECRNLQERVAELERKAADRNEYELSELCPGTVVYRYKAINAGIPAHNICQPCMDNTGKKSILQPIYGQRGKVLCPCCKNEYRTGESSAASSMSLGRS